MTAHTWTYEISDDGTQVHVYDSSGAEISASPHSTGSETWELPDDLIPPIATELQTEVQNALDAGNPPMNDRVVEIITVLAAVDRNIEVR